MAYSGTFVEAETFSHESCDGLTDWNTVVILIYSTPDCVSYSYYSRFLDFGFASTDLHNELEKQRVISRDVYNSMGQMSLE